MAKVKKFTKTVKKAGVRFNPSTYVEINADMTDFSKSIVSAEINGTTTEYSLGGGGDITIEALEVTSNGTYEAPSGKAYTPVSVNVPSLPEVITLYENSNPTQEMASETLFTLEELNTLGISEVEFVVSDTDGITTSFQRFNTEMLSSGNQGAIILTGGSSDNLHGRKIYRTSGVVKNSVNVYKLGATTEDRTQSIILNVYGYKYQS